MRLRQQRRHRHRRDDRRRHQDGHGHHPEPGGHPDAAWRSCPASCRGSGAGRRHRCHQDGEPKDADHPDGDRPDAHRWGRRCARGAAPDAACPGSSRTGCCPDAGCRRQAGRSDRHPGGHGRHRDGACPGWSQTGCCPGAGHRHRDGRRRDGHHGRRHEPDAHPRVRAAWERRAWEPRRAAAHQAWGLLRDARTPQARPGSPHEPGPGRVPPAQGSVPGRGRAPGRARPLPRSYGVPARGPVPEPGSAPRASGPRASRPAWLRSPRAWPPRPCRTSRNHHRRGTCRACAARRAARASRTPSGRTRLPTSARQAGSCFPLRALLRARRRGL